MAPLVMLGELMMAAASGSGLALAGSAHCAVMCGPISAVARGRGGRRGSALYFGGRVASYTLVGALAGSVGRIFYTLTVTRWVEAGLSWALGICLLYAALKELRGRRKPSGLVQIGRQARPNRAGRVFARLADEPLLLGAFTALLPCGMLFTAVLGAAALGTALLGALAMAVFAALSGLVLTGLAELSAVFTIGRYGRKLFGGALVFGALVLFARPLSTLGTAGQPSCHTVPAEAR